MVPFPLFDGIFWVFLALLFTEFLITGEESPKPPEGPLKRPRALPKTRAPK